MSVFALLELERLFGCLFVFFVLEIEFLIVIVVGQNCFNCFPFWEEVFGGNRLLDFANSKSLFFTCVSVWVARARMTWGFGESFLLLLGFVVEFGSGARAGRFFISSAVLAVSAGPGCSFPVPVLMSVPFMSCLVALLIKLKLNLRFLFGHARVLSVWLRLELVEVSGLFRGGLWVIFL